MKALMKELERQAKYFESEAEFSNDKFNKGYFEGKAEQCRIIIEMWEAEDFKSAMESLNPM